MSIVRNSVVYCDMVLYNTVALYVDILNVVIYYSINLCFRWDKDVIKTLSAKNLPAHKYK